MSFVRFYAAKKTSEENNILAVYPDRHEERQNRKFNRRERLWHNDWDIFCPRFNKILFLISPCTQFLSIIIYFLLFFF